MKPIYAHLGGAVALTFAITGCIPAPDSTPAPAPAPTPVATAPAPPPAAGPQPSFDNWMDAPQTPGDWSLRTGGAGTLALFGEAQGNARFSMNCDRANRSVTLMRAGNAAGPVSMTIRTETADRVFNAQPMSGQMPVVGVRVAASDPILDAMAITKGRFAVVTPGMPTLYLPAWAEVTRVIEDCR